MSSYIRKAKRQNTEKRKAPRCCGQHMIMNKYGLYQCRKCGRQKFDIGPAPKPDTMPDNLNEGAVSDTSVEMND